VPTISFGLLYARHPRFIETRHRCGYRFVLPAGAAADGES
jgi:hypothetical protein